jgi:hypothetical protein
MRKSLPPVRFLLGVLLGSSARRNRPRRSAGTSKSALPSAPEVTRPWSAKERAGNWTPTPGGPRFPIPNRTASSMPEKIGSWC